MHSIPCRERRNRGRRNGLIGPTSVLNDDDMATCVVLRIFVTRKVLGALLEVSRDSTRPKKVIAEQYNNF